MNKIIDLANLYTYSITTIKETTVYEVNKEEIKIPCNITDKLIRLTAKWTNRFASDLLISIDSMRNSLKEILNDDNRSDYLVFYFGFRKDGIDHKESIEVKTIAEYNTVYQEVWKIEVFHPTYEDEIQWKMVQLSDYVDISDIIEVEEVIMEKGITKIEAQDFTLTHNIDILLCERCIHYPDLLSHARCQRCMRKYVDHFVLSDKI